MNGVLLVDDPLTYLAQEENVNSILSFQSIFFDTKILKSHPVAK